MHSGTAMTHPARPKMQFDVISRERGTDLGGELGRLASSP